MHQLNNYMRHKVIINIGRKKARHGINHFYSISKQVQVPNSFESRRFR
jgi:hypothetical protein